jgi:hypothetical protein
LKAIGNNNLKKSNMQINLQSQLFKQAFALLPWVLFFGLLWFNGCSDSPTKPQLVKVIVPEVKSKFEAKKPLHEAIVKYSLTTVKGKTVYKENPIDEKLISENEKLKLDYAKANDSIQKLYFDKAVRLNKFSTKFEDDNLVLNINGIVQGEVKEITPNYIIKKREVEVPVKAKETVFRLLSGVEIGNNKSLNGFATKGNLMIQNRKGNIISASFDTNQTIWIGYNFSILNIKK